MYKVELRRRLPPEWFGPDVAQAARVAGRHQFDENIAIDGLSAVALRWSRRSKHHQQDGRRQKISVETAFGLNYKGRKRDTIGLLT
jgi:hypothetical protein